VTRLEFTVLGEPQPQGSKTIVERRGRRPVIREDNPGTEPWRQAVAAAAARAIGDRRPFTGPVRMNATFVFQRPLAHYGTGRNHGRLKPSAPAYCRSRPDIDKLVRAVCDAVAGIAFHDDARVVIVHAEKHYADAPFAHVVVVELELEDDRPPIPVNSLQTT